MYGQPEIHLVNGTSKVMFLKQTKSMRNLTGMYVQKYRVMNDRNVLEIPLSFILFKVQTLLKTEDYRKKPIEADITQIPSIPLFYFFYSSNMWQSTRR